MDMVIQKLQIKSKH